MVGGRGAVVLFWLLLAVREIFVLTKKELQERRQVRCRVLADIYDSDLARVFKQLMYFKFTQESVGHPSGAELHSVLNGNGPGSPGRFGPFARIEAADVFLEFIQNSVGHPSGAALHAT